jgi:NitT/TauT family transport system substrate-binding protein
VFGGPMPSACLYAKTDFIRANPKTVQALTNAVVRALRWLNKATVDDVLKVIPPEYTLGDRTAYVAALTRLKPVYSKDGLISPVGVELSLRVVSADDPSVRNARISLPDTFTNAFAQKVPAGVDR